jgi:hypothetical protein
MGTLALSEINSWFMKTLSKPYINPIGRDLVVLAIASFVIAVTLVTAAIILVNQL